MPAFFVPARNTRHRTACFALYKALLRQAVRVPLPENVATGSGPVNPIKHLIRGTFRRNKNDTSQRLVVCALQNGYKFLDLLTAAQTASSPQHASILSFLRTRLESRNAETARRAAAAAAPPSSRRSRPSPRTTALHPDRVPLLRLVSPATHKSPPVYEATARPLPLERLSGGVRKLPNLDETSGVPFLRLGRPQPAGLSRVLRQKSWRRQERTTRVIRLTEHDAVEAKREDGWEEAVGELLDGGGGRKGGKGAAPERRGVREGTFGESVREGIAYLTGALDAERLDLNARGKAMWKIVEAERALAEKERAERERRDPAREEEPNNRVERSKRREESRETEKSKMREKPMSKRSQDVEAKVSRHI